MNAFLTSGKIPVDNFSLQEIRKLHMKISALRLLALSIGYLVLGSLRVAAWTATDSASDPAYSGGWTNGSNGGSGFDGWQLDPTPPTNSYGHFIGSSINNGNGLDDGVTGGVASDGDIDSAGSAAWGIYANNGYVALGVRMFAGGNFLGAGQTFSADLDNGWIVDGAQVTLALLSISQSPMLQLFFIGGTNEYQYTDATGTYYTGIPFSDEGLNFAVTMTGPLAYTATLTLRNGTTTNWSGSVNQQLYGFGVQNNNAGGTVGGSAYDVFINNISVVPEPSTLALGALGLLALTVCRRAR